MYDNVGKPNEFHTQWDEIPLYMLGLMSSDEARKVKDLCIVGGFDMNGPNGLQDGISPLGGRKLREVVTDTASTL